MSQSPRSPGLYGIKPLRDDAFGPERAGMLVKCATLADLVVAVTDRAVSALKQGSEIGFAVSQRQRHQISTVEVQRVEDKIDEVGALSRSDAFWIRAKELTLSGRSPHNSPSR